MNQKNGFYGMVFSHGRIDSKEKIKKKDRYGNPTAIREVDKNYLPIFMFGTTNAVTAYSPTIVCFNIFANVFGTEFCEVVADALIKYGDNYMKRYRVDPNSTVIQIAVKYLFLLNQKEIEQLPQNRFYTFYQESQQPYDVTLFTNKVNETAISNYNFPTVSISLGDDLRYMTIQDFLGNLPLSVDEFLVKLSSEFKDANNEDLFSDPASFIGKDQESFWPYVKTYPFMEFRMYAYDFGICKVDSVFSALSMGVYVSFFSTNSSKQDDHMGLAVELFGETKLSNAINYMNTKAPLDMSVLYDTTEQFECRGLFTFCCKDVNSSLQHQSMDFQQQHEMQGILPYSQQELMMLEQEEKKQKHRQNNRKLVKKALQKKN